MNRFMRVAGGGFAVIALTLVVTAAWAANLPLVMSLPLAQASNDKLVTDSVTRSIWATKTGTSNSLLKIDSQSMQVVGEYPLKAVPASLFVDGATQSIWVFSGQNQSDYGRQDAFLEKFRMADGRRMVLLPIAVKTTGQSTDRYPRAVRSAAYDASTATIWASVALTGSDSLPFVSQKEVLRKYSALNGALLAEKEIEVPFIEMIPDAKNGVMWLKDKNTHKFTRMKTADMSVLPGDPVTSGDTDRNLGNWAVRPALLDPVDGALIIISDASDKFTIRSIRSSDAARLWEVTRPGYLMENQIVMDTLRHRLYIPGIAGSEAIRVDISGSAAAIRSVSRESWMNGFSGGPHMAYDDSQDAFFVGNGTQLTRTFLSRFASGHYTDDILRVNAIADTRPALILDKPSNGLWVVGKEYGNTMLQKIDRKTGASLAKIDLGFEPAGYEYLPGALKIWAIKDKKVAYAFIDLKSASITRRDSFTMPIETDLGSTVVAISDDIAIIHSYHNPRHEQGYQNSTFVHRLASPGNPLHLDRWGEGENHLRVVVPAPAGGDGSSPLKLANADYLLWDELTAMNTTELWMIGIPFDSGNGVAHYNLYRHAMDLNISRHPAITDPANPKPYNASVHLFAVNDRKGEKAPTKLDIVYERDKNRIVIVTDHPEYGIHAYDATTKAHLGKITDYVEAASEYKNTEESTRWAASHFRGSGDGYLEKFDAQTNQLLGKWTVGGSRFVIDDDHKTAWMYNTDHRLVKYDIGQMERTAPVIGTPLIGAASVQWPFSYSGPAPTKFVLKDDQGNIIATAAGDARSIREDGLSANQRAARRIQAVYADAASFVSHAVTAALPPVDFSAAEITRVPRAAEPENLRDLFFDFSSGQPFGIGGIDPPSYVLTQSEDYSWTGEEPVWGKGPLNLTVNKPGNWYLMLKGTDHRDPNKVIKVGPYAVASVPAPPQIKIISPVAKSVLGTSNFWVDYTIRSDVGLAPVVKGTGKYNIDVRFTGGAADQELEPFTEVTPGLFQGAQYKYLNPGTGLTFRITATDRVGQTSVAEVGGIGLNDSAAAGSPASLVQIVTPAADGSQKFNPGDVLDVAIKINPDHVNDFSHVNVILLMSRIESAGSLPKFNSTSEIAKLENQPIAAGQTEYAYKLTIPTPPFNETEKGWVLPLMLTVTAVQKDGIIREFRIGDYLHPSKSSIALIGPANVVSSTGSTTTVGTTTGTSTGTTTAKKSTGTVANTFTDASGKVTPLPSDPEEAKKMIEALIKQDALAAAKGLTQEQQMAAARESFLKAEAEALKQADAQKAAAAGAEAARLKAEEDIRKAQAAAQANPADTVAAVTLAEATQAKEQAVQKEKELEKQIADSLINAKAAEALAKTLADNSSLTTTTASTASPTTSTTSTLAADAVSGSANGIVISTKTLPVSAAATVASLQESLKAISSGQKVEGNVSLVVKGQEVKVALSDLAAIQTTSGFQPVSWQALKQAGLKPGDKENVTVNLGAGQQLTLPVEVPKALVTLTAINGSSGNVIKSGGALTEKIIVTVSNDKGLALDKVTARLDGQPATARVVAANKVQVLSKTVRAQNAMVGIEIDVSAATLSAAGAHTLSVQVEDVAGNTSMLDLQNLVVAEASLRVTDTPKNLPNPFSPLRDKETVLMYALSKDADVSIYIFDANGQMVSKKIIASGTAGGRTGANEVKWDGKSDFGQDLGNGVYNYAITAEGKVLGRGQMTLYR